MLPAHLAFLAVPLLVLGLQQSLAADGPPALDVERSCRDAATADALGQSRQFDQAAFDGCMAQENGTHATLEKEWASFPAVQRDECLSETRGADLPSYVELYECLKLDQETRGKK
ncbi:hypothetical protein IMF23_08000 [Chelatococcus daeguensis]|uniref:Cysteine rich repeat n=1 Tax=Chelatococcus sambhunathii TaxID=363953 RepID=A0ABM9TWV9_9HYPH|nr:MULTISPECIES: hypothetical protein [Chelatococcus]KZE28421.1 hypothetical protein AVW15_06360 [Chelatococcus daeguensis]MBM3083373.1 hypothetical protein [Chelatococcus daeguensis]CUA83820.1 hypothetical protein Ga0061061_10153 [Chelatococcus sambhunathii]